MTRNEAREILMQIMYEMDAGKELNEDTARKLANERLVGNHKERGELLLTMIVNNLEEIDSSINENSKAWKVSRMPKVDLAIVRLALGEVKYSEDVPKAVTVNEAINLAKKYSTPQSSRFIHGLLGAIINI